MMKKTICGITAEYNPFHKGHMFHISETRKKTDCDVLVAVMSGNFVQRGEPAVTDKFTRAKAAVENGVDLVIELPCFYAIQSANRFAEGAVHLLNLIGADYLSFGSECGNLENLQEIASTPINPDHLHQSMDTGMSFPRAYSLLTTEMRPNDILAVAYLKAMEGTGMIPVPVQRTTNYLDETLQETSSALAIRKAMHDHVPLMDTTPMKDILATEEPIFLEAFYPYLRTFLLTSKPETLAQYLMVSEGIENHLVNAAAANYDFEGFMHDTVNWRYTASRIRRTCLSIILQITKEEAGKLPPLDTVRVLAFNDTGRSLLHDLRKQDVHIASRFAEVPYPWRKMEYRSTLLYTSVMRPERAERLRKLEIGGPVVIR